MEQLIEKIKGEFETEVSKNDKRFLKLNKLKGDLVAMSDQGSLFELTKAQKDEWNKKVRKLTSEIQNIESQIEEIKNNRIYENAFEWRFEFPEVLNNDGDFVGFDVVIGNPPYIPLENYKEKERSFFNYKFEILERKYDSSVMFFIEGLTKLNSSGQLSFIAPLTWQTGENYSLFRKWVFDQKGIIEIINLPFNIFEDAYVETGIYFMINRKSKNYRIFCFNKKDKIIDLNRINYEVIPTELIIPNKYKIVLNPVVNTILKRLNFNNFIKLGDITASTQGLSGSLFKPTKSIEEDSFTFLLKGNVYNYSLTIEETYITSLKNLDSLKQFYEAKPKILIRRIINRQNRLSVAYTEEKMVFKKDINPFVPINEGYPAKYLLGIMASKLISYLYINLSSIATKDDFRQTTLTELRELLVPKSNKLKQNLIIQYVDEILNLVKNKPNADTQIIKSEIDRLVYELYGLTEEEIEIVENG
jgi:hypothetical protein